MLNAIRIVKIVITALTPLIKTKDIGTNKVIVMAVIKGDVHDVGKDIISTVLSCNGYRIIDLGTPVPANKIVQAAIKYEANAIWISGLTSSPLDEMEKVVRLLQSESLDAHYSLETNQQVNYIR